MKLVRAAVADDSAFFREIARDILQSDGDIQVVAEAANADEAARQVASQRPDILVLDIQMPGQSGLSAISEVMSKTPLPILVVTALPLGGEQLPREIVARGALQVVSKASLATEAGAAAFRKLVRELGNVPVVRHLAHADARLNSARPLALPSARPHAPVACDVVGIGASAGGPLAVAELLGSLPADFPSCIVIVQHLSPGFAERFAQFLQTATALHVVLADSPCQLEAGTVFVAPDDRHLVAAPPDRFELSDAPPVNGHRPSVDTLLTSLATVHGKRALGVILTGMGDDGAVGLRRMASAGAITLAQDEATSVVYGMPRAAIDAGAARHVLPLPQIGPFLLRVVRS